jgi:hypothetical protein
MTHPAKLPPEDDDSPPVLIDEKPSCLRAGAVFFTCVLIGHIPFLPTVIFLFPWTLLSEKNRYGHWRNILPLEKAVLWDVLEWGVATIVFACVARRLTTPLLIGAALLSIGSVAIAAYFIAVGLGYGFDFVLWKSE